jgi:hypothetical protein
MTAASAGYSGTPLPKKLGFGPGLRVFTVDAPADYPVWLGELPEGVSISAVAAGPAVDAAHVFSTRRSHLQQQLVSLRKALVPAGFVWVSWPKKAARLPTDITEDVIRELALPLGFVDIKVCAVSDVWSGLKLVIRKSERAPRHPPLGDPGK